MLDNPHAHHAFGIDVSAWQGLIHWEVIAAHQPKVVFAGIRATISWGYQDKWLPHNWHEAKRHGILRTAYHVVYPAETALAQMDNLFRALGSDLGDLPITLDLELDHGQSRRVITTTVLRCAKIILERSGRLPILYSRAQWVNDHLYVQDLQGYEWWLAQYLAPPQHEREHPGPPALPRGVSTWLIHQTGDRLPAFGVSGSKSLDYDRWNGSEEEVIAFAKSQVGAQSNCAPTIPSPSLSIEQRLDRLEREAQRHGWHLTA